MARRTHRMAAANPNVVDNGRMTQANSLTAPSLKRFPSFEDSLPSTTIVDAKTGTDFIDTSLTTDITISAGDDSYSLNVGSTTGNIGAKPADWASPLSADWLFFAVIRAKANPSDPMDGYAVYMDFSIASSLPDKGTLGIFPYMMRFRDDQVTPVTEVYTKPITGEPTVIPVSGWICDNCEGWNLVDGEVYSIGGAKRGDYMEHYFDGRLVGRVNYIEEASDRGIPTDSWNDFKPRNGIETSHSGYSGIGCPVDSSEYDIGHYPSDYYGMTQHVFTDGLPDDIEEAMQWMKKEWMLGNKVIWPGWVTLK